VRQPWAWAIFHAGKDVENRSWDKGNKNRLWEHRGRVAIHASKGMDRDDYFDAREFMQKLGIECPAPTDSALLRGGIIGSVGIIDVVEASESQWFTGPLGLVLRDARPCEFIPANGLLGFFPWQKAKYWEPVPIARWMREVVPGPQIQWRAPYPRGDGFACRYCLGMYGGRDVYVPQTMIGFRQHMRKSHDREPDLQGDVLDHPPTPFDDEMAEAEARSRGSGSPV